MLLVFVFQNQLSFAGDKKTEMIGSWKCEVANAPSEYLQSTIIISEKEGKLTGKAMFSSGEEILFDTVEIVDDQLRVTLNVDYNTIRINTRVEKEKMTGSVFTPDRELVLVATKLKEKK